jgi:hypothetical protein
MELMVFSYYVIEGVEFVPIKVDIMDEDMEVVLASYQNYEQFSTMFTPAQKEVFSFPRMMAIPLMDSNKDYTRTI